jgi:hypothetical protein
MSKDMVKSYHDEYINNMNNWEFLKNAYFGAGGFADSGYIEKYEKESQQKYANRKKNAYYLNYCATVIDTYNAHLFKKPVVRKSENLDYNRFIQDVNGTHKDISALMKEAFLYAQIFGYSFIVVDKPDVETLTELEELELKAYPYAYILPPQSVIDWSIDSRGEFNWVKVVEEEPLNANNFLHPNDKQTFYRIWTKDQFFLFNSKEELIKRGEHGLGAVPFILLQNKKGLLGSIIGKSEINDIAKINKRLYNLCSELDDLLRSQTFATLTYPALDAKDLSDVEIGTDRILTYDPSSKFAPAFISPSSDATKAYETRINALIEEIYRLARLNYKGGVSQSGVALSFAFEKTNQALSDKALNVQEAELKVAKIVCKWQESEFEGEIQYPLDFSLADIEGDLKMALDVISLDLSDRFNKEYKKSMTRKLLPKLPEAVKIEIDNEIVKSSHQ